MNFEEYLQQLADGGTRLKVADLQQLSGLSPERERAFSRAWPGIDVRRRRRVIQELTDLTEDNVDLDFTRVFLRGFTDEDADVRLGSVRGLWEYERTDIIDPLLTIAADDPDAGVRAGAALALGRFVRLSALGRLRERYFKQIEAGLRAILSRADEVDEVRARALEAIGPYDSAWVRQAVREAYESDVRRLKVAAVHAMGRSGENRWLPLVTRELGSDEAEIRYEAAIASGNIGDESAVPQLLPLINDPDAEVRAATVAALGEIGSEEAKDALLELADDPSAPLREAATAALALIDFEEDPLAYRQRF